jgi:hypothetical protein
MRAIGIPGSFKLGVFFGGGREGGGRGGYCERQLYVSDTCYVDEKT